MCDSETPPTHLHTCVILHLLHTAYMHVYITNIYVYTYMLTIVCVFVLIHNLHNTLQICHLHSVWDFFCPSGTSSTINTVIILQVSENSSGMYVHVYVLYTYTCICTALHACILLCTWQIPHLLTTQFLAYCLMHKYCSCTYMYL